MLSKTIRLLWFCTLAIVICIIECADAGDQCKFLTIPICDNDEGGVSRVLAEHTQLDSGIQYRAGVPGKRGQIGPRGEKGAKGSQGSPGMNGQNISIREVERIVGEKVKENLMQVMQMTGADFCKSASVGVYSVFGDQYRCDGQGWTIFQNRVDGSVNFDRNWMEYRAGFGNLDGNFWLGLDRIRKLVSGKICQLQMHVETFDGEHGYANYSIFSIGDEGDDFQLLVGGYSGNTGDSFGTFHNGMKFSTKDRDNDVYGTNCATNHGGWWHKNCFRVSLNAPWGRSTSNWANIIWFSFKGSSEAMKSAYMKLKCD